MKRVLLFALPFAVMLLVAGVSAWILCKQYKDEKSADAKAAQAAQSTQNPESPKPEIPKKHPEKNGSDDGKKHDRTSAEWWLVYATLTLMVFTSGLMVYTAMLWLTTQSMMEQADTTSKIHERAYLDAGAGGGDESPTVASATSTLQKPHTRVIKDGKMRLRLEVTNHGRTPAVLTRMCWHVRPLKELPEEPEYRHWREGGMKIGPDKIFTTRYYREYRMDWTEPHVSYGRVEYTDVFKKPHSWGFLLSIVRNDEGTDFSHPPLYEERFKKYWEET